MVGYRCKSNYKDIDGNIINQGDRVVYKEYNGLMKGTVRKIDNSLIIDGDRVGWTRVISYWCCEKMVLILEKNKDYEEKSNRRTDKRVRA